MSRDTESFRCIVCIYMCDFWYDVSMNLLGGTMTSERLIKHLVLFLSLLCWVCCHPLPRYIFVHRKLLFKRWLCVRVCVCTSIWNSGDLKQFTIVFVCTDSPHFNNFSFISFSCSSVCFASILVSKVYKHHEAHLSIFAWLPHLDGKAFSSKNIFLQLNVFVESRKMCSTGMYVC